MGQEARMGRLGILMLAGLSWSGLLWADESSQTGAQTTFASPKEAVAAAVKACKANDTGALLAIFGPDGKDVVVSVDPSDDADGRAAFVRLAQKKNKLVPDPRNRDKMIWCIRI